MTNWPPQREMLQRPAYRSLIRLMDAAIQSGELKPGERLPTQRQLAYDLGLSVQTVSRAYDRLIEAGMISGHVGRGTFVRAPNEDTHVPFVSGKTAGKLLDLSLLKPVIDHAQQDVFQKTLRAIARSVPDAVLGSFRPGTLIERDHGAASHWLGLCGLQSDQHHVIPTNGSTAAMTVALMTVAHGDDLIVTEEIGHHTLRSLTRYLGLRLHGLETDDDGLRPDAFEQACRDEPVKALYVMPTGLNPLAFTMSETRRRALVDIARKHDVMIIENHAWGPLQDAPPPPIAALAPDITLFFTSLTKCLMPGLRVGYLAVPVYLGSAASNRHLVTNWMATPLMVEIAARMISEGTAEMLLQRQRLALCDRADFAATALEGIAHRISQNGLHIWLHCADTNRETALIEASLQAGVAVAPGKSFAIGHHDRHPGVRLSLGGQSFPEFARGLRIVAELARGIPEPALMPI